MAQISRPPPLRSTFTGQVTVRKCAAVYTFPQVITRSHSAYLSSPGFFLPPHRPDLFLFELGCLENEKGTDQWMCFFGKHVHEHDDLSDLSHIQSEEFRDLFELNLLVIN
jgi:hypothetical protein